MSYHATGSYGGEEFTRPLPTGAVDIGEKLKGWLPMVALVGAAFVAMKFLAPSGKPKKRKNPTRAISTRARRRQRRRRRGYDVVWSMKPGARMSKATFPNRTQAVNFARAIHSDAHYVDVTEKVSYPRKPGKKSLKRKPRRK